MYEFTIKNQPCRGLDGVFYSWWCCCLIYGTAAIGYGHTPWAALAKCIEDFASCKKMADIVEDILTNSYGKDSVIDWPDSK